MFSIHGAGADSLMSYRGCGADLTNREIFIYRIHNLYSFKRRTPSLPMNTKSSTRMNRILASLLAVASLSPSLNAASNYWIAEDGSWNVPANWLGGVNVPGSTSVTNNADLAYFNTADGGVVTVDANRNLRGLVFEGDAGSFTFSGGNFILTGGDVASITQMSASLSGTNLTQNISSPILLTGNYTFANNSAHSSNAFWLGDLSTNTASRVLTLSGANTGSNTVKGVISNGSGSLGLNKSGAGKWTLEGANTFTGQTVVREGALQLSGANGALASSGSYINILERSSFILDNRQAAGGNNNNRLADAQNIYLGSTIHYYGSDAAATNSSESLGILAFRGNSPTVTVSYGGTNTATLTVSQFQWGGGAPTALINGRNLGKDSSSTTEVARFFSTSAPSTVGTTNALDTGINSAAKNTRIVTSMVGEAEFASGGTGTETGVANTFLTYNANTGLRPLNPTDEFTHNAIVTGHNTYITQNTSVASSAAVNAIVLGGGDLQINAGQTLTNTSGALLFADSASVTGGGTLAGGSTLQRFYVNKGETGEISALLSGSGGLNKSGEGALVLSGNNTALSGTATVTSGTLGIAHNGALGSTVIRMTAAEATLAAVGGARTIANDVAFTGDVALAAGSFGGENDLTITGRVYHDNTANVSFDVSNTGLTTFAGGLYTAASGNGRSVTITGTGDLVVAGVQTAVTTPGTGGSLTYAGRGKMTITAASTYQSGTSIGGGIVELDFSNMATPTNILLSTGALSLSGGTLSVKGKAGAFSTSQAMGAVDLVSGSTSGISLDANGGTGTTLTLGAWTRRTNSVVNINLGANTVLTSAPIASVATQASNSVVMGYATVTDTTGVGFGIVENGNVVRYTAASDLAANSSDGNTNFKTSGSLTMTAGAHVARSLSIDTSAQAGNMNLTGASLTFLSGTPGAILFSGSNDYTITGGTVGSNGSELIVHQMGTGVLTIGSQLMGTSGAFMKNGSGTVRLTGTSAFAGPTYVSQGTLLIDGTNARSTVTVNDGATIGGSGSAGDVTVLAGGILNPGSLSGRNFTMSSLVLNEGSSSFFKIDGSTGGAFDSITVSGSILLAGTLTLDFGSLLANGDSLDLFTATSASGAFSSIEAVGLYSGTFVDGVLDTGNQVLTFDSATGVLTAVPEPSVAFLLAGAGMGLLFFRRRRQAV